VRSRLEHTRLDMRCLAGFAAGQNTDHATNGSSPSLAKEDGPVAVSAHRQRSECGSNCSNCYAMTGSPCQPHCAAVG
jgi:hypothetical protein